MACDIMEEHKVNIALMNIIIMMTTYCVRACGLHSLVVFYNVETHTIYGEGNVTTRSEISIKNKFRSLRFWDIREGVALR